MEATAFPLFLTNTVFPAHSEWECCSKDNFPTSLFWSCYSRLSLPLCHIKHKLAGFISQPTLVLESAPRTQLSPNLSVLNFFICKQPHLCDTWHWEEFAVNIHKVSCFSDLFVKLLCPCAYGRNQWDFWWSETSAHLSDRPCLHLYSLCSAFILWFLDLIKQSYTGDKTNQGCSCFTPDLSRNELQISQTM